MPSAGFGVRYAAAVRLEGDAAEQKLGRGYPPQCAVQCQEEKAYGHSQTIHLSGERSI